MSGLGDARAGVEDAEGQGAASTASASAGRTAGSAWRQARGAGHAPTTAREDRAAGTATSAIGGDNGTPPTGRVHCSGHSDGDPVQS